jgi:hypothetical protein
MARTLARLGDVLAQLGQIGADGALTFSPLGEQERGVAPKFPLPRQWERV